MRAAAFDRTTNGEGQRPLPLRLHRAGPWIARSFMAMLAAAIVLAVAAGVGPKFLPYRTYEVLSGSMAPALPVGALIVDVPQDAAAIRPGDVITFTRPDNPGEQITHRVVRREDGPFGAVFVTKGDANGTPDSWRVAADGEAWKTVFAAPLVGYLLGAARTPVGVLLMLVLPALALVSSAALELWQEKEPE